MNIIDIIIKKRENKILTKEEVKYVIEGYVAGHIKDYQMSSLLMAICINGMNKEEIAYLTTCMLESGEQIDLSAIKGVKIDKHSTGGVGDKTTLILAPLVASLGVPVAKMSGRGLGLTGGTIDKLESISGFRTDLSEADFVNQVQKIGVALTGQTGNLVPADKKIYALRDVTGTVESISLIASSIMSKKLASGADKFVIDVKVGRGALMKTLGDAKELAQTMIDIGKAHRKEVVCFLTNMEDPLGNAIGNGVEVLEAIDCLKGEGPEDLKKLIVELASYMVHMGKGISLKKAEKEVLEALQTNKAYHKFEELVHSQKGDIHAIALASQKYILRSEKEGYITSLKPDLLEKLVHELGGGRFTKEEEIDYGVGVVLHQKVGDKVKKGDALLTIHYNKEFDFTQFHACFEIQDTCRKPIPLIYEIMR